MSPNQMTIHEAREKLARKEISAHQLAEAVLSRIHAVEPKIKAFVHVDEADMLAQAEAADNELSQAGTPVPPIQRKPLLGIPIAVKDVINVKGQPCWCCSKILKGADGRGYIAPYDATVIERLRAAGAVVFGRSNMDEFAMGSSTENSSIQVTHNPWDLDRIPGGSSGGSAAAVAADETLAALGSDTGGSIRQPAAMCGCVGIKPSYGRVSRYGLVAFASSLDQIGHLTKDVTDAAILMSVVAGHDARDSTSVEEPVADYVGALDVSPVGTGQRPSRERQARGVRGLKLGLPKEYFVEGMDKEVEAAVRSAVAALAELGAEIVEISLPHTEYAIATYYIIATAEASANLARFDGVRYGLRIEGSDPIEMYHRTRAAGFGPEVKRRIILGTYVLSSGYYDAYYLRAQKVRTLIRNDFLEAFKKCDAILTPTAPTAAFRIGEKTEDPLQMYLSDIFTISCNLAGICGISIPCGFTKSPRLPIGLQILGKPFGETTILCVAHAYEQATEWHKGKPQIAGIF